MAEPQWESENDLQEAILRFLKGVVEPTGRGVFWRQGTFKGRVFGFTEYARILQLFVQGRFREAHEAFKRARAVSTGREGIPDIGGVFDGKAWMCEVKLPGQRPEQHQEDMMNYLQRLGVVVVVAHSVREVEDSTIPRRRFDEDEFDYSSIPF